MVLTSPASAHRHTANKIFIVWKKNRHRVMGRTASSIVISGTLCRNFKKKNHQLQLQTCNIMTCPNVAWLHYPDSEAALIFDPVILCLFLLQTCANLILFYLFFLKKTVLILAPAKGRYDSASLAKILPYWNRFCYRVHAYAYPIQETFYPILISY